MKVAMLTPMPPARTGVAHYASLLAPELAKCVDLEVISDESQHPAPGTQHLIYQLGNNPHHEWIYKEAMRVPGTIVLHDFVLHHLIVEMTLARGDVDGYVAALEASHGAAGAAWARGRAIGLHSEIGNFLLPASIDVANRSRSVIVHNRYAADRLRSFGVKTPIHVIGHPYVHQSLPDRTEKGVIGFFGFLTSAKRGDVVLQAFARARQKKPHLRLLVVGEPAPNIDVTAMQRDGVTFTGYVPDEEFASYYAVAERFVNLRYPSAGETSGTLIRAFDAGKPVAVSDYAQFAELPDDCVVKIPFGDDEVNALAEFFVADLPSPAREQRAWLEANCRVDVVAKAYVDAMTNVATGFSPSPDGLKPVATLDLFPSLRVSREDNDVVFTNQGTTTIRTHTYGQPGYRVIVKFDGDSRWIEFPRDLAPGESVRIPMRVTGRATFHHALQSIAIVDDAPFAELEL